MVSAELWSSQGKIGVVGFPIAPCEDAGSEGQVRGRENSVVFRNKGKSRRAAGGARVVGRVSHLPCRQSDTCLRWQEEGLRS